MPHPASVTSSSWIISCARTSAGRICPRHVIAARPGVWPIALASTLKCSALLPSHSLDLSLIHPHARWVGITSTSRSACSSGSRSHGWPGGRQTCRVCPGWGRLWVRPCWFWWWPIPPRWAPRHRRCRWKEYRKRQEGKKAETSHCDSFLSASWVTNGCSAARMSVVVRANCKLRWRARKATRQWRSYVKRSRDKKQTGFIGKSG
jgi:hypothetical protein